MFEFTSPGCVAFSILGFDIYYYGILMGFAIFLSLFISNFIANKFYKYNNLILDVSPLILLFGIFGARLYYCVLNYSYYISNPMEILAFRNGGLSIHGALIGGVIAIVIEAKRNNKKVSELLDIFAYSLPLGQAVARWGNFFNSEAFGYPTNLPWKLFIPIESRPLEYIHNEYFHPTFLYESILDLFIFFTMLLLLKKHKNIQSGKIAAIYLLLYSIVRIFVELFRIDCSYKFLNLPIPIVLSIILIVFCLFYLVKKHK